MINVVYLVNKHLVLVNVILKPYEMTNKYYISSEEWKMQYLRIFVFVKRRNLQNEVLLE